MKTRQVIVVVLLFVSAISAVLVGLALIHYFEAHLSNLCSSLQIVVFVFTASAGLFALIKYWESVEAELNQKRWKKLVFLESSYKDFMEKHLEIIQAFDYPHMLREKFLPLCVKAFQYDAATDEEQLEIFTQEELDRERRLDNFLEFFENLYFVVQNRLLSEDDVLVYLRYYILLLGNIFYDTDDTRLRTYIERYYYNIPLFLDTIEKKLKRDDLSIHNPTFCYYPRSKEEIKQARKDKRKAEKENNKS